MALIARSVGPGALHYVTQYVTQCRNRRVDVFFSSPPHDRHAQFTPNPRPKPKAKKPSRKGRKRKT